ncbi:MAG: site-2 protease family protein [Candidatus Micrarchaeia archaeon]
MLFDDEELQHLAISVVAISVAIAMVQIGLRGFLSLSIGAFLSFFLLILLTTGMGFILHELAHKFAAQRFGMYAAYRAWPAGLLLMLLFPLMGFRFVFAAPGATYIFAYRLSRRQNGLISLAGPLTNALLAAAFLAAAFLYFGFGLPNITLVGLPRGSFSVAHFFFTGASINVWLGFFNLIPLYPLDGSKVLAWNWVAWAALTGILGASLLFLFF